MNLLKDNWTYAKVSDFAELLRGISYKKDESRKESQKGYKPMLRSNNINYELNFIDLVYVPEKKIKSIQFIKEGDIIFAMSSGSKHLVGKSAQSKCNYDGSYGAFCGLLRVSNLMNKKYVGLFFKSQEYRKYISRISKGTNINNLKRDHILEIDFPLAPLNEQNRIVEKIEELFSDLDKAVEDLKKTQEQLKIYRQAVLKAAFEGKLTEEWREKYNIPSVELLLKKVFNKRKEIYKKQQIKKQKKLKSPEKFFKKENITEIKLDGIPDTWKQIKFIDLIKYEEDAIKRGPFGSAIKKVYFVPRGYKVYEQKNAINDDATLGNYYINETKYKELERFSVKGGDYIISCSGTIGRISKLPKDASKGVINQALLKIVLEEDLIIDKLFLYLFRAEFFQRKVLKETRGSAMKNIASVEDIKNINVLLPSKEEQEQILQEIESRLSVCDKLEETVQQSLEKIEYLRQSILKKAFEGNLVQQDPNDEPAEKLLERIKQEKGKFEFNNKKRKKR